MSQPGFPPLCPAPALRVVLTVYESGPLPCWGQWGDGAVTHLRVPLHSRQWQQHVHWAYAQRVYTYLYMQLVASMPTLARAMKAPVGMHMALPGTVFFCSHSSVGEAGIPLAGLLLVIR